MNWVVQGLIVLYAMGFVGVFILNTNLPVSFAMVVLRALVWPVWLVFDWPRGDKLPMD